MRPQKKGLFKYLVPAIAISGAAVCWASPSEAFVNQIVIDSTNTATYCPIPLGSSTPGSPVAYTIYTGRIFGELNPNDSHNSIITDINLAPRTQGHVTYIANFSIVTPTDPASRNGLMIYEVSNRGGSAISPGNANCTPSANGSMLAGVTYVQSGWQGDLLTQCDVAPVPTYPCANLNSPYGTPSTTYPFFTPPKAGVFSPTPTSPTGASANLAAFVIQVPVATTDRQPPASNGHNVITGPVYGHILNPGNPATSANGHTAQLVIFGSAFVPYQPAGYVPGQVISNAGARFWSLTSQSTQGVDGPKTTIPNGQWAFAYCPNGWPGTPNPYFICLQNGTFNPQLLYEMVLTAQNPLVLGVGFAATRDLISFLRYESTAPGGGSNPISGSVSRVIDIGASQSGSLIRGSIFYGFNQDESNRIVVDGAWPQIDGRMMWMNERWAQPNVIPNLYMGGDESPVWWADFPDVARHLPPSGLLSRCERSRTCPEILESFGSNEFYDEKMGPDMTDFCAVCFVDIPVPPNVHRYYLPGTSHGGGAVSFTWSPPPATPVNSSQTYPSNPNPENFTNNALQADFVAFIMNGTPMPFSFPGVTYPTLTSGQLVPPNQRDEGFPNVPGFPFGGNMAWPPFVYNFGPGVDYSQQTGIPTFQPPIIQEVLTEYVPRVNRDGNEDVGSVPSVLFQAPLGSYVGWNIIPPGDFYSGQQVQLAGGFWPFQETKTARMSAGDPRQSLEERYGTNAGYVCVVTRAANKAVAQRFLLQSDAQTLIADATASNVLAPPFAPTPEDANLGNRLCSGHHE
jgi:hypothetical protein